MGKRGKFEGSRVGALLSVASGFVEVGHPCVFGFLSLSPRPQSGRVNSRLLHTTFTPIRASAENAKQAEHKLWSSITSICKTVSPFLDCMIVSPRMFPDKDKSMNLMTHSNSNVTVTDIQHRSGGKSSLKPDILWGNVASIQCCPL